MRWTKLIALVASLPLLSILWSTVKPSEAAVAQQTTAGQQEDESSQQNSGSVTLGDTGTTAFIVSHATRTIRTGRHIFRFDTFGDEAFWGGDLKLHRAI